MVLIVWLGSSEQMFVTDTLRENLKTSASGNWTGGYDRQVTDVFLCTQTVLGIGSVHEEHLTFGSLVRGGGMEKPSPAGIRA